MPTVDISVGNVSQEVLKGRLDQAADWMRSIWQQAVSGTVLPGMTAPVYNNDYAESLRKDKSVVLEQHGDQIIVKVETNYPHWKEVEEPKTQDWKAVLLDPQRAKTQNIRRIEPRTSKKGEVLDPGGFSRVIPLGSPQKRGVYDAVRTGDSLGTSWTNFDADAAPSSISDPTGTATKVDPTTSLPRPPNTANTRSMSNITFRTVSTPRFDHNGRPLGSKPNSWMQKRPANPVVDSVFDYCSPHVKAFLTFS